MGRACYLQFCLRHRFLTNALFLANGWIWPESKEE
jgi:hypothetical protein